MSSLPPQPATQTPVSRKYRLERVDEAAVVQVYADGFASLPLDQKQLIWHLYRAAIAGRDIFYDQRYAHNLDRRDVLEANVERPELASLDPEAFREIQRYTKLFWLNTGPYNNLTARKFLLKATPERFSAAAHAAADAGAAFPTRRGESLDQLLARLKPMFFDAAFDPFVTSKTPGPGQDILEASANNLYVGVTMKDLEGWKDRYELNSRVVKEGDGIVEEVYRIGGRYDAQLREVV
jgi:dipeptidyl-peptidase-3